MTSKLPGHWFLSRQSTTLTGLERVYQSGHSLEQTPCQSLSITFRLSVQSQTLQHAAATWTPVISVQQSSDAQCCCNTSRMVKSIDAVHASLSILRLPAMISC